MSKTYYFGAVTPPAPVLTVYPLLNNMFHANTLNVAQGGETIHNPWSSVPFVMPPSQTMLEVQVTATLPHDNLRFLSYTVNGTYSQLYVPQSATPTWYTLTVPANATVRLLTGFLEKGFTGVYVSAIRVTGTPSFIAPTTYARNVLCIGDSIWTGAFDPQPGNNGILLRTRRNLPSNCQLIAECYSARQLADDYGTDKTTQQKAAFITRLLSTNPTDVVCELTTNDRGVNNTPLADVLAMYAAFWQDLHAAAPSVRKIMQVPSIRTDFGAAWIQDLQNGVAGLTNGRPYLEVYDSGVTADMLDPDGLHWTAAGHAQGAITLTAKLLNSAPAFAGVVVNGTTAVEEDSPYWNTGSSTWDSEDSSLYSSNKGVTGTENSSAFLPVRFPVPGYFVISTITGPTAGKLQVTADGQATATVDLHTDTVQASHPVYTSALLPIGDYSVAEFALEGNVTRDLITFYLGAPPDTPVGLPPLVVYYNSVGVALVGFTPEDPNTSYVAQKGAFKVGQAEDGQLYWEVAVPDSAVSCLYENFPVGAQYGGATQLLLDGDVIASGTVVGPGVNVYGTVALPAGSNRVLRHQFDPAVTGQKVVNFDKLTFNFS